MFGSTCRFAPQGDLTHISLIRTFDQPPRSSKWLMNYRHVKRWSSTSSIVGGGPSGLAAAIRLKQLAPDAAVCLVEKGGEIGGHILSGAVLEPRALNELIPDWKEKGAPLDTPAARGPFPVPDRDPRLQAADPAADAQHGNYIVSPGQRRAAGLAQQAEELGVEIYPGFAAVGTAGGRRPHRRHRHRRHGHRQGRPADRKLPAGHGTARATTRCSPRAAAALVASN